MDAKNDPFVLEILKKEGETYVWLWCRVFNNFVLHFMARGRRRTIHSLSLWHTQITDLPQSQYRHSTTALGQTYAEFYETLDLVARKVTGLRPRELSKKLNKIRYIRDSERQYKYMYELLSPVWVELRRKGYIFDDLWP